MSTSGFSTHLLLVTLALYLNSCTSANAPAIGLPNTEPLDRNVSSEVLLNSERIEQKFGSYAIEILATRDSYRLSKLYSTHRNVEITRTLALVKFSKNLPGAVADLHKRVVAGASLGATFKRAGWRIKKTPIRYDTLYTDSNYELVYDLMHLSQPVPLAMQVYAFEISNPQHTVHYADIVEIYHPEYLRQEDFPETLPSQSSGQTLSQNTIRTMLNTLLPASSK